jgi:hypothetical protein
MDFAERLSLWVSAFDAIGLQASLQSIRTLPAAAEGKAALARSPGTPDLADDFQKVPLGAGPGPSPRLRCQGRMRPTGRMRAMRPITAATWSCSARWNR